MKVICVTSNVKPVVGLRMYAGLEAVHSCMGYAFSANRSEDVFLRKGVAHEGLLHSYQYWPW
jgi:hypothetical protein